jgi:pimeloyl-ACP methyl ester carboxylesterase
MIPSAIASRVEHRVVLAGYESVVTITGEGDDVFVLLPAIGMDRSSWDTVAWWMPEGVRCVAADLRGFGSAITSRPESMGGHAEDLLAMLDELGIGRAHVIGHSYGGAVAATFALAHPDRVTTLGMVASVVSAPAALFEERARSAEADGDFAAETVERWFTEGERAAPGRPIQYVTDRLRATPAANWAAGWRVLGTHDIGDRLGEFEMPTTIVAGEWDTAVPPHLLEAAAGRMPNATYALIAGGAHMLPLEQPFELARLLYSQGGTRD